MFRNFKTQMIEPIVGFNERQYAQRNRIAQAIEAEEIKFYESKCLCGKDSDNVVCEHDAWGFPLPSVLCDECQLIRAKFVMDDSSVENFYSNGFYGAHQFTTDSDVIVVGQDLDVYYHEEFRKGKMIYEWLNGKLEIDSLDSILDIGCGCGGVLAYFKDIKTKVGCDFNQRHINFGKIKDQRLDLKVGSMDAVGNMKFDLIILSDVLEHVNKPEEFLKKVRKFCHENTYIYINVPGFYGISFYRFGNNIRQFLKIEHFWCFTKFTLENFMNRAGFKMLYGNQFVMGLFQMTKFEMKHEKKISFFQKINIKLFLISGLYRNIFFILDNFKILINKFFGKYAKLPINR